MFEWLEWLRMDLEAGEALGEASVPADHPLLLDHFPGVAVLPATLLLELAAQVAGPLAEETTRLRHGLSRWALLGLVRHAVFTEPVLLPARLRLQARVEEAEPSSVILKATAMVDGPGLEGNVEGPQTRMRAELVMAMAEARPEWEAAIRARHARLVRWGTRA
jgi:3-hydroxymyristoyl/3-hydroxydecanoyl-(acyl carrier protein) dehydratase